MPLLRQLLVSGVRTLTVRVSFNLQLQVAVLAQGVTYFRKYPGRLRSQRRTPGVKSDRRRRDEPGRLKIIVQRPLPAFGNSEIVDEHGVTIDVHEHV